MNMKMALRGDTLLIKDADYSQLGRLRSWTKLEWDERYLALTCKASLDLLNKIAIMVKLPPSIEAYRLSLQGDQTMALEGNTLRIWNVDNVQFAVIKSWNKMRWDKKSKSLVGIADLELLEKLAKIVKLPPYIEARRQQMQAVADAVDRERMNENPVPFYKYPVKLPLYAHQTRGANMALLTFGWVLPERSGTA